jgi:hypothetical protein
MSDHMAPHTDKAMEKVALEYSSSQKPLLRHITSGYDNHVVIVDDKFALRFPRDKEAQQRQALEAGVLGYLKDRRPPLMIPKPISQGFNPRHYVYSALPGRTIPGYGLLDFSGADLDALAKQYAIFVTWLAKAISPDTFKSILKKTAGKPDENWEEYIKRTVGKFASKKYPTLSALSKELINKFIKVYPEGLEKVADRVIHNDLHSDNMAFDGHKLVGVLDFGDMSLGTIEQELRYSYWVGSDFMKLIKTQWSFGRKSQRPLL